MVNPLEPLPSQPPVSPQPATPRAPAADRRLPAPAASGRRPAGDPSQSLVADVHFDRLARQIVISLVQPETRQVGFQIPPEKILKLAAHLKAVAARMFDQQG